MVISVIIITIIIIIKHIYKAHFHGMPQMRWWRHSVDLSNNVNGTDAIHDMTLYGSSVSSDDIMWIHWSPTQTLSTPNCLQLAKVITV